MDTPLVQTQFFSLPTPFFMKSGVVLTGVEVAYEVYGQLNAEKSNAILLFHAMTGSQHAHGYNPCVEGVGDLWQPDNYSGWWDAQIGSGKALDTDKFCIICANFLGGCYGTTGPCSLNPETGMPWSGGFPRVTTTDQACLQALLLDYLGIDMLHAIVAPSVGGLVGLTFSILFPERVKRIVSIGSGYKNSMNNRLVLFEQILAIESDFRFCGGYYSSDNPPNQGLALARIISHKSFVCLSALEKRARAEVRDNQGMLRWYTPQASSESYMLHQGAKLARRFDANAYLRIVDMWAHYDVAQEFGMNSFADVLEGVVGYGHEWLIFAIDSDLCFLPNEQADFAGQLAGAGIDTEFVTIHSEKGHDSFLLEPELYNPALKPFLAVDEA